MENIPFWMPSGLEKTQMDVFAKYLHENLGLVFSNYFELHQWSIAHIAHFWQAIAHFFEVDFTKPPQNILNESGPLWAHRWFEGAHLNFAQHMLSHADEHIAIMAYDEYKHQNTWTYGQLKHNVAYYAQLLKEAGVTKGDRVVAVLSNTPEAIAAMLATASLGAIWASCSPDFGETALIERFSQIEPKCLFSQTSHVYAGKTCFNIEKMQRLMDAMPSLKKLLWVDDIEIPAQPFTLDFVSVEFNHPLCILFSSGTTGKPKCIVHRTGGVLLQHLKELGLHTNLKAGERFLFYTTCGWMMWNWMLSALGLGVTVVLYDGSPMYPHPKRLLDVVAESKTEVLGASAAYFASLEKQAVEVNAADFSHLKTILSTGSPLLASQYDDIQSLFGRALQVSSISGGSDIISCFALGNPNLPVYRGELQCLGLGMDVDVWDESGHSLSGQQGELVCKKPFPSMPLGFWNDDGHVRYMATYFQGFPNVWAHGDYAEKTEHGGLIIYGRSDATLNPHGVRFGTAELYQVILQMPEIVDCIAVGQDWQHDTRVILFVQLALGINWSPELKKQLVGAIRQQLSPRHVPAKILAVRGIPKTMNGKIMETAVRKLVNGQSLDNLSVIVNPECLDDFIQREELQMD